MCAGDYGVAIRPGSEVWVTASEAPWDPELATEMDRPDVAAYEEDLIELLVGDVLLGAPPAMP